MKMSVPPRRGFLLALVALLALIGAACGTTSEVVVSTPVVVDGESESVRSQAPEVEEGATGEFGLAPLGEESEDTGEDAGSGFELDFGDAMVEDEEAAGPGDGAGVPAGASLLTSAAITTETSNSYRYELSFAMRVGDGDFEMNISPDEPLAIGAVVGTTEHLVMDLGAMFDDMFASAGADAADADVAAILGADLRMETIVDGTSMYLYAPFFAEWSGLLGGSMPALNDLAALEDGWGFVDLTQATGVTADELSSLLGAQTGGSFDQMLELMKQAGVEVSEVGSASVRGVETTQLRALVNMGAMLEAQGMSAADLGAAGADMAGLTLPFDVYVDAEERVRRVVLTLSIDSLRAAMPNEPIPASMDFEMTTVFDVFDFGADIQIDVPSAGEIAVDLTDAMQALASF